MAVYVDGAFVMNAAAVKQFCAVLPEGFRNATINEWLLGEDVDRGELVRAINVHARFAAPDYQEVIDDVLDRIEAA